MYSLFRKCVIPCASESAHAFKSVCALVFFNQCVCLCIAVPIVRWRSVRCAAVRRPLSSSLLALWQASRQLPEMQDSVLGKEMLFLSPPPPLSAPPPPHTLVTLTPDSRSDLSQTVFANILRRHFAKSDSNSCSKCQPSASLSSSKLNEVL